MARIRSITGEIRTEVAAGWELALSDAGQWKAPAEADSGGRWLPAIVPGTLGQALEKAGEFDRHDPLPLHGRDAWYRVRLPGAGQRRLRFDGLATFADIWLENEKIGASENMFLAKEFQIESAENAWLHIHFKALLPENLPRPGRRQRWRPHLIADPYMRHVRSTLLGHMPGWCPDIDCVGPWRPVTLISDGPVAASRADLRIRIEGSDGILDVAININGIEATPVLRCAGVSAPMTQVSEGRFQARLRIPDVALWWPHTHGAPTLHDVDIVVNSTRIDLGRTGFRAIELDRGAGGEEFCMKINGVRIFCRGASWTASDLLSLSQSAESCRPLIELARDAGMNMLRVSGIMAGEGTAFGDLCDTHGILHWRDLSLANFDYDFMVDSIEVAFGIQVEAELGQFLDESQGSPSLAVVCGGSEIAQQAAMLSLPREHWTIPFFEERLPALLAAQRPNVITIPHTPWGGDLPFHANAGVSHYYGVGAYCRPLEDARRAEVKFASECLAFANLPQPAMMALDHAGLDPAGADWKARVVRDLKAAWDFEDTRDYYLDLLYGVSSAALKHDDPERYIHLSQAVSGEVMEASIAEWRRAGSCTSGALVWFLSDLGRGFGWGVIDWRGEPKPAYYALKRAFRPVQVLITDEGVNGLQVHVINETGEARTLAASLHCLAGDGSTAIDGRIDLTLQPRETRRLTQTEFFGVFFDATCAYRFGPPAHVVSVARLWDGEGKSPLAEAFHFPLGRGEPTAETRRSFAGLGITDLPSVTECDPGLAARLERGEQGWFLVLRTRRLAQSVHVECPGYRPDDDWFHLAPGAEKVVRLRANDAGQVAPGGRVVALWDAGGVTF